MRNILSRLLATKKFDIIIFGDKCIIDEGELWLRLGCRTCAAHGSSRLMEKHDPIPPLLLFAWYRGRELALVRLPHLLPL